MIESEAAVDLIKVDLNATLWEDPINVDLANSLIDKKYDEKKNKAKLLIKAYSKFQGVLTDEQKAKLKNLCSASMKQKMMCGPNQKCPMKK